MFKRTTWVIFILIISVLLIIFIIKPNFLGFSVEDRQLVNFTENYTGVMQQSESQVLNLNTSVLLCNQFNERILRDLKNQSDKLAECASELTASRINFNEAKKDCEERVNDSGFQYNILGRNTANNLCCKAKIDNPDINYYKIEDNSVICLEKGELVISC